METVSFEIASLETCLRGSPICPGIGIGKPYFFSFAEDVVPEFVISVDEVEREISRYQRAIGQGRADVKRLQEQLERERIMEGFAILDAQLQMMHDPLLTTDVEYEIRKQSKNAEFVFQAIVKQYRKKFDSIMDPFFRERFKDIQDISRRVMSYLLEGIRISLTDIPHGSIIFAYDFTASEIAEADSNSVGALVCQVGSFTSHAAIVAKAKGIPYITGIDFEYLKSFKGDLFIADGHTGDVIVNPSSKTMGKYEELRRKFQTHFKRLGEIGELSAETYDGYTVRLSANVEMVNEIEMLHEYKGNGIGLFRSEYIVLSKDTFPNEDEQYEVYQQLVKKMKGLPIVIRTFDIGGDKFMLNSSQLNEENPFLGCRAIRFLLKEREIFKIQLRAILRASVFGNVSILFPMISNLSELQEAKLVVQEARQELEMRKEPMAENVRIGCMIEVPSAAIISDLLAKHCDFLSIGTNDLVQYALAVDRGNHAMSDLYTPTHPSIIRLIKLVVTEADLQGILVAVCGEVAADPRFTPLLLGLGVHELSVASRYIPLIKNVIRNTSIVAASRLAEKVLALSTSQEIQELLDLEYRKNVPDDFL